MGRFSNSVSAMIARMTVGGPDRPAAEKSPLGELSRARYAADAAKRSGNRQTLRDTLSEWGAGQWAIAVGAVIAVLLLIATQCTVVGDRHEHGGRYHTHDMSLWDAYGPADGWHCHDGTGGPIRTTGCER